MPSPKLDKLRLAINENIRVQKGGSDHVPYIDVGSVLSDVGARQNHVVFGRRGCGKTLLLHHSGRQLGPSIESVYLNCEDFKRHSFPNVLIEILDALFAELEEHLRGWFGKKKRSRELIASVRSELRKLKAREDIREREIREIETKDRGGSTLAAAEVRAPVSLRAGVGLKDRTTRETEKTYRTLDSKIQELDTRLPRIKTQIREFLRFLPLSKLSSFKLTTFITCVAWISPLSWTIFIASVKTFLSTSRWLR